MNVSPPETITIRWLIQDILGQPTEIPLVEVNVESDKLSGNILCGLIDKLPKGVDFLIGTTCKR